jgi:hypothetical protein
MHKLFGFGKQPALHKAVQSGQISDVRVLLQRCPDIDEVDKVSCSSMHDSSTPTSTNPAHPCYVLHAALSSWPRFVACSTYMIRSDSSRAMQAQGVLTAFAVFGTFSKMAAARFMLQQQLALMSYSQSCWTGAQKQQACRTR